MRRGSPGRSPDGDQAERTGTGTTEPHHPYHLVDPSPWPVGRQHVRAAPHRRRRACGCTDRRSARGSRCWASSACSTPCSAGGATCSARAAPAITPRWSSKGLRIGMALFITSEVLFFFAFFWAFFWGALYPPATVEAISWPPEGVAAGPDLGHPVPQHHDPAALGLHGDLGAPCRARERQRRPRSRRWLLTVLLGVLFTCFQAYEYVHAIHEGFTLSERDLRLDLLHGDRLPRLPRHDRHDLPGRLHDARLLRPPSGRTSMSGFEAAAWYWHFVDVVWLFLFVWVYWWGGSLHFTTTLVGRVSDAAAVAARRGPAGRCPRCGRGPAVPRLPDRRRRAARPAALDLVRAGQRRRPGGLHRPDRRLHRGGRAP